MKGHNYVASVAVTFTTLKQAENFIFQNTLIGGAVKVDLEDQEILDLFEAGEGMTAEIDFPDGFDAGVQAELDAAVTVGAELTLTLMWEPNE